MAALSDRFDAAFLLAHALHRRQRRKGGEIPYLAHLMTVAAVVLEFGGNEDEAIAALLHDAVEDQGGVATRALIQERFSEAVATIVDGCTDADELPKPPWIVRKEHHLAQVRTATPPVRLVLAADKLHNTRSLLAEYRVVGEALWERFTGGREGTLWYYRAMTDALLAGGRTPLIDELDRAVRELEALTAGQRTAGGPPAAG